MTCSRPQSGHYTKRCVTKPALSPAPRPHPAGLCVGRVLKPPSLSRATAKHTEMGKKKSPYLSGFLLELLNGSLVDTTAFVDEMAGGGGLSRVDMADNHDADMRLFLAHDRLSFGLPRGCSSLSGKRQKDRASTCCSFKAKMQLRHNQATSYVVSRAHAHSKESLDAPSALG